MVGHYEACCTIFPQYNDYQVGGKLVGHVPAGPAVAMPLNLTSKTVEHAYSQHYLHSL